MKNPIQVPQSEAIERDTRRNLPKEVGMFLNPHLVRGPRDLALGINQRKRRKRDGDQDLVAGNEEGQGLVRESQVGPDLENEDVDLYQGNAEDQDLGNGSQVNHDLEKGDNQDLKKSQ